MEHVILTQMPRLDFVIFGATGFTGQKVVEECIRMSKHKSFLWGIAGRNKQKLEDLLMKFQNNGQDTRISNIQIIISDVNDTQSLKQMCSQAKIIVNCAGPYIHYGEQVVKACIEQCAHHLDVSGEPEFIETMQLKYDEQARRAGVFVISACGLDSVPNDLGVIYLQRKFVGVINTIESYLSFSIENKFREEASERGYINCGTWNSFVFNAGTLKRLGPIRKKIYPEPLPKFKPKLSSRGLIHRCSEGGWSVPFPGVDKSVVYRTQRFFYESSHEIKRPIQFKTYIKFSSLLTTFLVLASAAIAFVMSKTKITRNLLLKYPHVFSLGLVTKPGSHGPAENVTNNTNFEIKLYGKGWNEGENINDLPPRKSMVAVVHGLNPVYGVTANALMMSAITILEERDKMPESGGVLTAGAAFSETSLIEKLEDKYLHFYLEKEAFNL